MLGPIFSLIKQLREVGESIVGIRRATAEPAHTVEQMIDGIEIRRYGTRIAAQTTITADEEAARNAGFRRLAGYIFGDNHAAAKIAMTAPVAQQAGGKRGEKIAMTAPVAQEAVADNEWVIRFFMPADKTLESLPQPNNPAVQLLIVPEEIVAVRRFSGSRSPSTVASQTAMLMTTLREKGVEPAGTPVAWFYDPPWTVPMLRRNEIAVRVNLQS